MKWIDLVVFVLIFNLFVPSMPRRLSNAEELMMWIVSSVWRTMSIFIENILSKSLLLLVFSTFNTVIIFKDMLRKQSPLSILFYFFYFSLSFFQFWRSKWKQICLVCVCVYLYVMLTENNDFVFQKNIVFILLFFLLHVLNVLNIHFPVKQISHFYFHLKRALLSHTCKYFFVAKQISRETECAWAHFTYLKFHTHYFDC